MGKPKNNPHKKRKQILVFDEHLRREYLTGFHRRKQHRKRVAREDIVARANEARKEVKEKYHTMMKQSLPAIHTEIPDIPKDTTASVYDLPEHTVTITDISFMDISGADGRLLGQNTFDDDGDEVTMESNTDSQHPTKCIMRSLKDELIKIEVMKQKKKKKVPKRKGPLKKGTHKRRNNPK